jgi:hypothetical protein
MSSLGLLLLGAFIGTIVTYGLKHITDWTKPGAIFTAVISAAVAGGVYTFIQYLGGPKLGAALYFYPVGLAYGALCANMAWLTDRNSYKHPIAYLHILGFVVASILLLLLLLYPPIRSWLPPDSVQSIDRGVTAPTISTIR